MSNNILCAKEISFGFLKKEILEEVSLVINKSDKITLLGKNGMGKSTLLKILQNKIEPDSGVVEYKSGLKIASLPQRYEQLKNETCKDVLLKNNSLISEQQAENLIRSSNLTSTMFANLSGGQQRSLMLRSVLISEPDLIILDEPTNHIDIVSIRHILKQLKKFDGACLIISHDRWFVEQISQKIWDLHNKKLTVYPSNFNKYLESKQQKITEERSIQEHKINQLKKEEHWLQRGVTARRKRNVARLEKLHSLREDISKWRDPDRKSKLKLTADKASADKVIIINNLSLKVAENTLLKEFSATVFKGEKIGLVGVNGSGKSTLIKQIIGGNDCIKIGERLSIGYFAQTYKEISEKETVLSYMTKYGEYIIQGDKRIHVASYLKGFNFDESQFKTPVNILSGGERHRLMLAKCLAKPTNFLILDEPTNDLDLDTLEILEQMLVDFKGTLIIISHDQKFLDNVITTCWVLKDNKIHITNGDIKSWEHLIENKVVKEKKHKTKSSSNKLSYKDQLILNQLPGKIEQVESEITRMNSELACDNFYKKSQDDIKEFHHQLESKNKKLEELYELWQKLEDN